MSSKSRIFTRPQQAYVGKTFTHSTQKLLHRLVYTQKKLQFYLSFLAIEPHFVRKGCAGRRGNRNLTSVFGDRTSFRAKGLRREPGNRNFTVPQFLTIEPHFVRKGCAGRMNSQFYLSFGAIQPHFVRKGLRRKTWKSQFDLSFWRSNLISCERDATGTRKSQFYCTQSVQRTSLTRPLE